MKTDFMSGCGKLHFPGAAAGARYHLFALCVSLRPLRPKMRGAKNAEAKQRSKRLHYRQPTHKAAGP
jgi:hypothetical protein